MFRLPVNDEPIKWPVKVSYPKQGGGYEEGQFTAHFKRMTLDEIKENDHNDTHFSEEVLVGWEADLLSEDGTAVEFSSTARSKLVGIPYVRRARVAAYYDCSTGGPRKN